MKNESILKMLKDVVSLDEDNILDKSLSIFSVHEKIREEYFRQLRKYKKLNIEAEEMYSTIYNEKRKARRFIMLG